MIDDLVRPTIEVSRVLDAVAEGDLSQKMSLKIEGQPVRGEFLRIGTTVNTMLDQLSSFASEVTRVARDRIWVEPNDGPGSAFHVEIPAAVPSEAQNSPRRARASA